MKYLSLQEAVDLTRGGDGFIIIDDKDRENEGDLFFAAEKITAEKMNFLIRFGRGLVCAPLTQKRAKELQLPLMVSDKNNQESTRCKFTVSVDARQGIATGISAPDRSRTLQLLSSSAATTADFVRPGHIFPLIAHADGLRARSGHTEAAVTLCQEAGLTPVGVICELIADNGTMARGKVLQQFAARHGLGIITIAAIKAGARTTSLSDPSAVKKITEARLPTNHGEFLLSLFEDSGTGEQAAVLTKGGWQEETSPLLRIHSQCLTGESFLSQRCDCREQFNGALKGIHEAGSGLIIYMFQEGRGIGLSEKIRAYALQDRGLDTLEANLALGFAGDERDYALAGKILQHLKISAVQLITNNPEKIKSLQQTGIQVEKRIPTKVEKNDHNRRYLLTKKHKFGHL